MKHTPIFLIAVILLLTRLFFYFESNINYQEGDEVAIEHVFRQEPKRSEFGQYFMLDNILVSLPSFPSYEYGDKVKIEGRAEILDEEKNILILKNPTITPEESSDHFLSVLRPIRQRVIDSVMSTIPAKEGGLLLGIVLGLRDKINPEYYEKLQTAGVLHVVAASGQNASIVSAVLMIILLRILRRNIAIVLTVLGVFIYAALTGFDPPIIRASIMAVISLTALMAGRQKNALYGLFITAYLMILVSPDLISDVSFILSFMSTLGIVIFNPILNVLLDLKNVNLIKEDIVTTISAQLGTFPILLNFFESYSLLSIPVNILVLFTIPFIMILGGIGAVLSLISPIFSLPFYYLSYPFLAYFGFVVEIFANFEFFLNLKELPFTVLIGYYLVLGAIILNLSSKKDQNA